MFWPKLFEHHFLPSLSSFFLSTNSKAYELTEKKSGIYLYINYKCHFCPGISGCGLPCRDPLYTEDEHQQIHRLIAWGAGICLALNLLTVATFLIDWRSANKYPALVIFYINVCFAVASMG